MASTKNFIQMNMILQYYNLYNILGVINLSYVLNIAELHNFYRDPTILRQ